jgi:hypothetical protein
MIFAFKRLQIREALPRKTSAPYLRASVDGSELINGSPAKGCRGIVL